MSSAAPTPIPRVPTPPTPADPAPSTAAYWNERSPDFHVVHARLRLIGELVAPLAGVRTVLDVGCASGALRSVLPPTVEYFGIDLARSVIAAHGDPSHFEVADLDGAPNPFGERRFDLLVCSGVFEYVNDRAGFMRMLARKAAPGGWLVLSFTNHQHRKDGLGWLTGRFARYTDPHVNFLRIPAVRRLLEASGWRVASWRSLTASGGEHPLLRRCMRFPLNVLNRQYVFVCRRAGAA